MIEGIDPAELCVVLLDKAKLADIEQDEREIAQGLIKAINSLPTMQEREDLIALYFHVMGKALKQLIQRRMAEVAEQTFEAILKGEHDVFKI